jgi:DNA-binding PadR family transcriptional regulator
LCRRAILGNIGQLTNSQSTEREATPMAALAPRDLLILAVLADGPIHGYGIIKAVEERSSHDVLLDPANLYRCLRRMSQAGWIAEQGNSKAGDRRRTFRITATGKTILHSEVRRLEALLRGLKPALASGRR